MVKSREARSPTIPFILGPTASGKSAYALRLAAACNGVIVNADSMQLYHGAPILTAQPTAAEQAAVPHRLYGYHSPLKAMSAAHWCNTALEVLKEVLAAGHTPIIVGGTGLYVQALLQGLSPIPPVPLDVRLEIDQLSCAHLYIALQQEDPMMAARLNPHDRQRLARALEVFRATGRSLAWWQQQPGVSPFPYARHITVFSPPRAALYARINQRLEKMVADGAVEEAMALSTLPLTASAQKILGLREFQAVGRDELVASRRRRSVL